MERLVLIKRNAYHDSVTLMAISAAVQALPGIEQVQVAMGTQQNQEQLARIGLLTVEAAAAGPNDLVVAIAGESQAACQSGVEKAEAMLQQRGAVEGRAVPRRVSEALQANPGLNLALISVPGQYAAREARLALEQGLNVMLFSDNLSLEEEVALKRFAQARGLMVMGPDCGTAIINGVGLAFANVVRSGPVGIVGASGTGIQEVTVLLDRLGVGISHAIGTGGRDLSAPVGGITMLAGIQALAADPATQVILLLSKPPAEPVARRVVRALQEAGKPAVVCFLGSPPELVEGSGVVGAATLEEAALRGAELAGLPLPYRAGAGAVPREGASLPIQNGAGLSPQDGAGLSFQGAAAPWPGDLFGSPLWPPNLAWPRLRPERRYIRGLFCGGTLCTEAELIVGPGHTFIDFGDDQYTVGRPHPMIDPSLRNDRIRAAAADPETGVILFDLILGYGAHSDPAGMVAALIEEARGENRGILFVASVCGAEKDPQGCAAQVRRLAAAGVVVAPSNAAAARLAVAALRQGRGD